MSSINFSDKTDDAPVDEWLEKLDILHLQRSDMNSLIMDYLVTEGFKEAAEKFQVEAGIKPSVDLNTLDDRIRIRDAIQNGGIQEAICLINQLHPELLDNDRYLYFLLQQQHLIELIRNRQTEESLKYAQENLSERGEENKDVLNELERTLALLAFEEPEKSPFGDLLHLSHRQKVASEVNAAILRVEHKKESTTKLARLWKLVLWAQDVLDKNKIKYPKLMDLANGTIKMS